MNDKAQFLAAVKPFDLLPEEVLISIADILQEVRYTKETVIYLQEKTKMKGVDIIVEGEYEAFFYDSAYTKRMVEKHGPGVCYGGISVLLNKKKSIRTVIAKKGTLVYFLPKNEFKALCRANDMFFHHFTVDFGNRMLQDEYAHFVKQSQTFEENYIASDQLYSRKIESVNPREIVSCPQTTPVHQVAKLMAEKRTSCLFVTDDEGKINGYVTDMSLRDNVIAQQKSAHIPIAEVMDNPIVSIDDQQFVYEAILMMFSLKIRYMLILSDGEYTGFLSRNRLLSEQAQSPFVFIQSVKLALTVTELKEKWHKIPEMVFQLLSRGVKAEIVNQMITTVSDAILVKVIEGVIAEVGEPPAKFVFMALGSEGRKEQTLKTDQDNAIIYEDKANEHREEVREYFLHFADLVSARLDNIGFSYCTGGFMAKNPKWTHSLSHWKRNYAKWISEAIPESVINISTFFDCRFLYGEESIMKELKGFLDQELQKPLERFFYHIGKNALQYEPPLTFFKNIKTFQEGEREVFNIKKTMTPIVDLVRVFALKHRIFKTNTGERVEALKEKHIFTEKEYHELMQSYYYMMGMRLKKQAVQIINDDAEPDNLMDINGLTKIERVTLREIFKTIENFQLKIKISFTNSLFG